jgi:peptidoglycan/LPS O-acetylase OafA/YrhL
MLPVLRAKQLQGGVKGFALGRVRRILPPYYAALAISLILALCFIRPHSNTRYDVSLPVTHSGVLAHLLLVQDFHWSVYEINGPMWSIAVEVHIYLLFPLFVWLWKHLGILPVLVLSGILSLSLSHLVSIGVLRSPAPAYIFVFGFGMAAACFSYGEAERWLPRFSISLLATIAVISFVLGTWLFQSGRGNRSDFMIGISAACFLAILSRNATGSLRRRFSAKWLVLIGGFSYSLYLLHFPFQQLFWQWLVLPFHLSRMAGFLIVAGPGTVVILLLCYLFYRVFERPFMRQKPVV